MSELPQKSQFLIYQAEGGKVKIDVRFENETVWLTQQHMADLFQTTKQNIGQHLKNIFEEGELAQESVVKHFFTTAADGKNYSTNFHNLDAIIFRRDLQTRDLYNFRSRSYWLRRETLRQAVRRERIVPALRRRHGVRADEPVIRKRRGPRSSGIPAERVSWPDGQPRFSWNQSTSCFSAV